MGHKKVAAKPGPLKWLAVLAAAKSGADPKQLAKATGFARSSIYRWTREYDLDAQWAVEMMAYLPAQHRQRLLLTNYLYREVEQTRAEANNAEVMALFDGPSADRRDL